MEGKNVINDKAYNHHREQLPQAGPAGLTYVAVTEARGPWPGCLAELLLQPLDLLLEVLPLPLPLHRLLLW